MLLLWSHQSYWLKMLRTCYLFVKIMMRSSNQPWLFISKHKLSISLYLVISRWNHVITQKKDFILTKKWVNVPATKDVMIPKIQATKTGIILSIKNKGLNFWQIWECLNPRDFLSIPWILTNVSCSTIVLSGAK